MRIGEQRAIILKIHSDSFDVPDVKMADYIIAKRRGKGGLKMMELRNSRILRKITLFVLLVICLFGRPTEAKTSIYVFDPNQSTVVQTGGIAGVHETYGIEGQFQLTVDYDAGIASFDQVDANLTEPSGFLYTQSLGVLFNMTELASTAISETEIEFEGKTAENTPSDILLRLTFTGDSVHLVGDITPPPWTADFFYYDLDAVALKKYGGGTGEPNDPYLIYTAEQMNEIGLHEEDWDKHFKLMADIDLSVFDGKEGRPSFNIIAPDTVVAEFFIFFQGTAFTGVFDGNDHTISNFSYISTDINYIGFFGCIDGENALIKDLGLIDPDVDAGTAGAVGTLAGQLWNGTVTGCYVKGGSVLAGSAIDGRVIPGSAIGGLVGQNYDGTITDCYASASVSGTLGVGGLVGDNSHGTITDCYASASVSGNNYVGGLLGSNSGGKISKCYAAGSVSDSGTSRWNGIFVGGLVGYNNLGTITDCYASASVSGNTYVGGLVGDNDYDGRITTSYSTGTVSGSNDVGGLVGSNWGEVTDSFWDIETSGQATSAGGTGKTTEEMLTASTFLEAGWDFVDETENGIEDIWCICEGVDYPKLTWQFIPGDFNEDYNVDLLDFAILSGRWSLADSVFFWCRGTDLTGDGFVDFNDLEVLAKNWLTGITP
jgi:hypothetical protein